MLVNMLHAPFNYQWPGTVRVSCIRDTGAMELDDAIAVAAIDQGYAVAFNPVTKRATSRRNLAMTAPDVHSADTGPSDRVDREDMAAPDSAGSLDPVADAE